MIYINLNDKENKMEQEAINAKQILEKERAARIAAASKEIQDAQKKHRVSFDVSVTLDSRGIHPQIILIAEE